MGMLTYISNGEMRRPFLGLKLAIWAFSLVDFLGRKILAGLLIKSACISGSQFYVKELHQLFHL